MKTTIEGFEDSGVSLPADKRPRAKAINDRITDLGQKFEKEPARRRDQGAVLVEDLAGVPEASGRTRRATPRAIVLLGLDYPIYFP
jgi:thimet oligopeptidase